MKEHEYDTLWSDRALRYPDAQPLPTDRSVHIEVDPEYARTYAGQVATITAASLLGRMTKFVSAQVPSVRIKVSLPWSGDTLDEIVMKTLKGSHPYGSYGERPAMMDDLRLHIGPRGNGLVVHGSGWGAYCGS